MFCFREYCRGLSKSVLQHLQVIWPITPLISPTTPNGDNNDKSCNDLQWISRNTEMSVSTSKHNSPSYIGKRKSACNWRSQAPPPKPQIRINVTYNGTPTMYLMTEFARDIFSENIMGFIKKCAAAFAGHCQLPLFPLTTPNHGAVTTDCACLLYTSPSPRD